MRPHGADLLDEDPVGGTVVGPFEPDWFQFAGFDDQSHADVSGRFFCLGYGCHGGKVI